MLEHAGRYPDTRRLASDALRAFVLDRLPDPDQLAARGEPVGAHVRERVRSVRRILGASGDATASEDVDPVAVLGEYEALNALLNYRQGALRGRLERDEPARGELGLQRDDFTTIGALGDAARVVLLGGPGIFSSWELLAAAWRLDVTPRHRLRLVVASMVGAWRRIARGG